MTAGGDEVKTTRLAVRLRVRRPVLLGVVALVITLMVGLLTVISGNQDSAHSPNSAQSGQPNAQAAPSGRADGLHEDDARAIQDLLDRRALALTTRDRTAFLETVDPQSTKLRDRQEGVFDNLSQVPLETWRYRLDATVARPLPAERLGHYDVPVWAPGVTLEYALRNVDQAPTGRPQYLTFAQRDGQWRIAADDDFASQGLTTWRGPWDFGFVVSHETATSLILAHPDNAEHLGTFAASVNDAVAHVTSVVGSDWPQRVAVLIPSTSAEMDSIVGQNVELADIAAVATADYADVTQRIARGQRVVINPANLIDLSSTGRTVMLRHEITHIATRAFTSDHAPQWLLEGFADYVGYLGLAIPLDAAAGGLAAEIQQGEVPSTLPGDHEFRADNPRLSQSYEEAWLACRLLADRIGQDGLVNFYRMVAPEQNTPEETLRNTLHQLAGVSYEDFVSQWRQSLVAELS